MIKVALVRCDDYGEESVKEAVDEALEIVGPLADIIEPEMKVLLKPNLLSASPPDRAITTHPAVVAEVARRVLRLGARAIIADSPGSGYRYTQSTLANLYSATGMKGVAEETGAELNTSVAYRATSFLEGRLIKRFDIIEPVLDADIIINLPKAKTHDYMYITGAVKNLFGAIPGLEKPGFHSKLRDQKRFATMLIDLHQLIRPVLTIMDAVVAMEGDGPTSGSPRKMGVIIASRNAPAVDVVLCRLMGQRPERFPTIAEAVERGLLPADLGEIEVTGSAAGMPPLEGFVMPATVSTKDGFTRLSLVESMLRPLFRTAFSIKPAIDATLCKGCGICKESCPVGAIEIKGGVAKIDDGRCIRCYCCHEMCPEGAVFLKKSFLNRLFLG